MRFTIATAVLAMLICGVAAAELQQVEVSGSLRIRGSMYSMDEAVNYGDVSNIEQRTRLGVTADFTDEVSAFIEFDSYDVWGEDFRSNYVTGVDGRALSTDDVELYQGYIQADAMWGTPLSLRVGRQEISLGSEWLVGVNDAAALFQGLSFDALRLDYATDMFSVTAIASKLAEAFGDFGDDDTDFYAVYGSYLGIEDVVIDAYWMFVRDEFTMQSISGIPALLTATKSDLHTVGLRGAGSIGAFDFEAEAAYQFGDLDIPATWGLLWKIDNDLDYGAFGVNLEAGYTFDCAWTPRVYLGFAYLEGAEDDELAFNRLFSNWEYSEFIENTALSNAFVYRGGVGVAPTETISLALCMSYFVADETDSGGWGPLPLGG